MNQPEFTAKCLGIFIRDMIEDRESHSFDWSSGEPRESDYPEANVCFVDVSNADKPVVHVESVHGNKQFRITITEIST